MWYEHDMPGDHNGNVRLWDIQNVPPLAIASFSGSGVTSGNLEYARQIGRLEFAPDGKRLAIVRKLHSAEVWNVDPARLLATFPGEKNWAYALAFSPDGRRLVGGQEEVKIWEIDANRRWLSIFPEHFSVLVLCPNLSPAAFTLPPFRAYSGRNAAQTARSANCLVAHQLNGFL
jgi:WD40 repeat protein